MWCLIYLERESPNALVGALKENTFDVHIAPDIDDLLDALWYHGSAVGCVVVETEASNKLQILFEALDAWPKLRVFVFGPTHLPLGKQSQKHHFERAYSPQSVSRWLSGAHPEAPSLDPF